MPFSLINKPSVNDSSVSPAYNEILPGWALYNNYYMIIRNENKFMQRNKSKRNAFETQVIRQSIVDLMFSARSQLLMREPANQDTFLDLDSFGTLRDTRSSSFSMLRAIGEESEESENDMTPINLEVKDMYTDSDVRLLAQILVQITGIGKNMMTERSSQHGINIYSYFIRLFYLRKLKSLVQDIYSESESYSLSELLSTETWREMKEQETLYDSMIGHFVQNAKRRHWIC